MAPCKNHMVELISHEKSSPCTKYYVVVVDIGNILHVSMERQFSHIGNIVGNQLVGHMMVQGSVLDVPFLVAVDERMGNLVVRKFSCA